ncbi:MAG TPA: alpha/beta hydrolase [Candidatus Binataceae bacterium]|nr:alpha/beta hydrolase [Candidatus Binataceae bacterium]
MSLIEDNGSPSEPWHFEQLALASGLSMRIARAGAGVGPMVVMLHGFPECWYSWRHQMRALSRSFDCVAPEMRGYGATDAPRGAANYTLDKLVGDVADLLKALGRKRAVIVGHDWGGAVAWATALKRPEIVERLIVMNCPHLKRFSEELRRNPRQMLRSWYMLFFQLPWLPEAMFRAHNFRALDRALQGATIRKDAITAADLTYFHEAFRNPYSISAAINYYRASLRSGFMARAGAAGDSREWIDRKIAAPTMLIWGERDFALGKELTYRMEPLFSGSFETKYLPGAGHWVQQEEPELVSAYMREFLRPLAPRR